MTWLAIFAGLVATEAGMALLYSAWLKRGGAAPVAVGWALLAAGVMAWRGAGVGMDKAVALALLAPALVALPLVAARAEWRPRAAISSRRPERASPAPPAQGDPAWRSGIRTLIAGPLVGAVAVALGTACGVRGPGDAADRALVALYTTLLAWAGLLVWATTDPRIVRPALGLSAMLAFALLMVGL